MVHSRRSASALVCSQIDLAFIYQSKDGKEEKIFDALEWPR